MFLLTRFQLFGRLLIDLVWMEFWKVWSAAAEAGLRRGYQRAGAPVAAGLQAFVGRVSLQIWQRRLGGRAAGSRGASRLYRVSRGDDWDVSSAQFFVNSSLALVLLLRRGIKSVADVLKGIRENGLMRYWVGGALWALALLGALDPPGSTRGL